MYNKQFFNHFFLFGTSLVFTFVEASLIEYLNKSLKRKAGILTMGLLEITTFKLPSRELFFDMRYATTMEALLLTPSWPTTSTFFPLESASSIKELSLSA